MLLSSLDAIIGFDTESYLVTEGDDPLVEVGVSLIHGQLEREVVIQLKYISGTATCV